MATIMTDIKDAVKTEVAAQLGPTYKELAYVEDVAKNSLRTSSDRYGVRALALFETDSVTKYNTYQQNFELIISRGYIQSSVDDTEQVDASYDLRAEVFDIYKRLVNNKGGSPANVMNVNNLTISEPEYLEDDKVVIIRANFDILYRLTLL